MSGPDVYDMKEVFHQLDNPLRFSFSRIKQKEDFHY